MKKNYILLGVIFLVTLTCWLLATPIHPISSKIQISQFLGALTLVGFSYVNFISTRHPLLDGLFNGLDKAYIFHKWVSIISIVLVIAHIGILASDHPLIISRGVVNPDDSNGMIGWPSFALFTALTLIAILAKKMNYEVWKTIHKFLFLPYFIGLVHYYRASDYDALSLSPFNIWLNLINLIGIISAVYSIFLYEKTAFRYRYKISQIKPVAKDTIEIIGNTTGKGLKYAPGQFTFLKFMDKNITFPSHPFTMSQAPQKEEIQFTIKSLGDHTARLVNKVKIGDEFAITKSHGANIYSRGSRQQVWIAGGMGITQFRSFYKSGIPDEFSIDFFYAYNNKQESPYLEEIKALNQGDNLRVYLIDFTEKGFLTVEKIKECVNIENPVDIYFCGPEPMRNYFKKNLKNSGLKILGFHYEEFKFK
jgi:predicted ferric reductase